MSGDGARIWIQGDLHAENFGTYLDAGGRLVFDVNDFDEAYLGHWTWDLRRFVASLALLGWQKALPDEAIDALVETYVRAYVEHVHHYVEVDDDTEWALTLANANGAVLDALQKAKLRTRVALLESVTVVESFRRRFADHAGVRRLPDDERDERLRRLHRVPGHDPGHEAQQPRHLRRARPGRQGRLRHRQRRAAGVQRAHRGLQPGPGQRRGADPEAGQRRRAQPGGARPAGARLLPAPRAPDRAVASGRCRPTPTASSAGPRSGGRGFVVSEYSPYEQDLDWAELTEPEDICRCWSAQLGQATAKIHCVADDESDHDLVPAAWSGWSRTRVGDDVDGLVRDLTDFAHRYADRIRDDHRLFVDAFRGGAFRHRPRPDLPSIRNRSVGTGFGLRILSQVTSFGGVGEGAKGQRGGSARRPTSAWASERASVSRPRRRTASSSTSSALQKAQRT